MRNIASLPQRRLRWPIFAGSLLMMAALVGGVLPQKSVVASKSASDTGRFKNPGLTFTSPVTQTSIPRLDLLGSSGPKMLALSSSPAGINQPTGLIGLESVSVGSVPALADSFDSAQGSYSASNKGSASVLISNGPVSIDGSKIYGDVRSATSGVTLKSSSLVTGNVVAGATILNGGTIKGAAIPDSPSASIVGQAVAPCSPFSPVNRIGGQFSYDAAKGDLTITGNNGATLGSGSYCFHNLTLSGSGKLRVSGAVTIYLTGQFTATGNSSSDTGGVPAKLQILSSYTGRAGVLLSGATEVYMTMYAPQTSISLIGKAQLYGAVLGKTLSLSGNPSLHFDSRLTEVSSPNAVPIVNAGANQAITLPAAATLTGSATDDGLPNPPAALTYLWSQDSGPAVAAIVSPTQLSTQVTFPTSGTYVFRLIANDGALTGAATVQVTVNSPVNQVPVVTAGANQTITLPATASLAGSATDDGLPNPPASLSYVWSQDSGPVPALIATPTQAGAAASFVQPGTYVLRLTASDGTLSSSATTEVTVNDGAPALAAIPDRTIPVGMKISFRLAANDANARDTLTYFLDSAPAGATFNPNPVISWTPTAAHLGTNAFTARVVDAAGHSDSKTFRVTVTAANQPPQLGAQADERAPTGGTFARTLAATDADAGDTLTFELVSGPAGLTLSGNQLSWNPVSAAPGDYPVTIKVTDSAGALDSARFNLSVFPVVAAAARDDFYETSLGQTLFVPPSGVLTNDADPNGGTLTAAKLTNPDKGTISAFNADGSFTYVAPAAPDGPVLDVRSTMSVGSAAATTAIIVADINNDGKSDMITHGAPTGITNNLRVYSGDTGALLINAPRLPAAQIGGQDCGIILHSTNLSAADIDDDGKVEIVMAVTCVGDANPGSRLAAVAYDQAQPGGISVKWMTQPIVALDMRLPQRSYFSIARLSPGEKPVVLFGYSTLGVSFCQAILNTSTDAACRAVWAYRGEDGTLKRLYYTAAADQVNLSEAYQGGFISNNGGYMGPVVADVDNDSEVEILYEGTLWKVDGMVKHQFDDGAFTATQSSVVVDLDGDAQMEIVTLNTAGRAPITGSIKAWKADGSLLWSAPLPRHGLATKLSVADVDRDGHPDFIFGIDGTIWVIDQSGRIKWLRDLRTATDNFTFQFNGAGPARFPVYDLNGDGIPEMIVQYGNNTILFLRADTGEDQISWTYPGTPFYRFTHIVPLAPVVADVDGSGHASLIWYHTDQSVFESVGHLMVMRGDTVPWQPAPTHFNQAAYWESNFNADGSVPVTYTRHTTDSSTNVFGQQPQAPYASGFIPANETSFNYSATNTAGLSGTATVKIKIAPHNSPPVFKTKPPKTYVGPFNQMNIDYLANAVDPDPGDTITYALVYSQGNNGVASVETTTGVVHLSQLFHGDQHFIISATDNHGAASYQAFTLRMVAGMTTIPNVIGMAQTDASSALATASLTVGHITQQHNTATAGTVLGQSPNAGTILAQSESVDLTVSLGPTPVIVPNVTGNAATVATTTLSASGFTATTTRVFSNTIPAGTVISQSPAAGTFLAPTPSSPVTLTVSAGNGLSLALNRSVVTADQTITVTPQASDLNGSPTTLPALTYSIAPKQTPFMGSLPSFSGVEIMPDVATLGSFTITATDTANSRSVSADFSVLPPRVPGTKTNGESFAHMLEVLERIHALRQPLKAALAANDTAQMTNLLRQMVTLWRTVDLDDLRISQPLATPDQFAPTLDMMTGFGLSATPDDVISHKVLQDSIDDLTAWTKGLQTSGVSLAQLQVMADQFSTRAARMDGLVVSSYGGINNSSRYTRLMTRAIPEFYEALTNELAQLTGLPVRNPSFPSLAMGTSAAPSGGALSTLPVIAQSTTTRRDLKGLRLSHAGRVRSVAAQPGTLAELAVTTATQLVVDKLMEEGNKLYKNAKQFAVDVMCQAAWTAAAVTVANQLRAFLQGKEIIEVVSGASLSFREFQSAPAWIETNADDDPGVNVVLIIGPDLFTKSKEAGEDFVKKLQEGYSKHLDPNTNQKRYKNADQIKDDLSKFLTIAKNALGDANEFVKQQAKLVFQSPDETMRGCLFTSDAQCRQLIYNDGFQPVYTYAPPPGFQSLGGLPVPIIYIVYNAANGEMSFGTPLFLPCTYTSGNPKMVQCPNNPPFPP